MFKVILFISITLFVTNCSVKSADVGEQNSKNYSVKKFKDENFYLLLALDQELKGDINGSNNTFYKLYGETGNIEYLREHLALLNLQGNHNQVIEFVTSSEERSIKNSIDIARVLTDAYIKSGNNRKAIETFLKVIDYSDRESDFQLLAELYFQNRDYENSLKYMRKAYLVDNKPEYMEGVSKLLYLYVGRTKEAIRNLETHKLMYGCNKFLCLYLINFYSDMDNVPMVIDTYKDLYKSSGESRFALKVINIYKQQGNYPELIEFLNSSSFDNMMLLKIYMTQKKYAEGLKLSKKLYKEESKPEYLAQSAIFEYEKSRETISRNGLISIVIKLEKAVEKLEDALYLNYLGYLMIDNDIRVKDGVSYVKRALQVEPESIFFLDSLAWGYYKLGRCEDAKRELQKVVSSGIDDDEIIAHWRVINRCLSKK